MPPLIITPEDAGQRLDRVLARLAPDLGLRGRRRLCAEGRALVNGRPAPEAFKVRAGDTVEIAPAGFDAQLPAGAAGMDGAVGMDGTAGADGVRVIARAEHVAALYKPVGLHSAALAGRANASLEALLPGLLPPGARLLNRLDQPTSGLVIAALDAEGEAAWHGAQKRGLMEKRYLALLEGDLERETLVRPLPAQKILTPHEAATRSTRIMPLGRLDRAEAGALFASVLAPAQAPGAFSLFPPEAPASSVPFAPEIPAVFTLALCVIARGSRHQIRAHAAHAGFPLAGDARHGGRALPHAPQSGECFFLHHGLLRWPGFEAYCPPPWADALPPALRASALARLAAPVMPC